ncbi:hypothetical protein Bca4012_028013 [Brassica carinata]
MASKVLLGDLKAADAQTLRKVSSSVGEPSQQFQDSFSEGLVYTMSGFNTKRSNNNFRLSDGGPSPYASMMTFLLKS